MPTSMVMWLTPTHQTFSKFSYLLVFMMGNLFRSIAELLSPRYCECCGSRLAVGESLFCSSCLAGLPRRGDVITPTDNPTVRLLWGRVAVERGVAWIDYLPHSALAEAIYSMKYRNRSDIAFRLGCLIAKEYAHSGFFDGIDMIIPMPLHPKRERARGYNQSREFADGLSDVTGIPVRADIVARIRNTASQTTMSQSDRPSNVHGAFSLLEPCEVEGCHVLVVDDIITTGASIAECGMEIAKANDVTLSFLTIGHTV